MNLLILMVAVVVLAVIPIYIRARRRWRENDRRIDEATRRHAYLRRIAAMTVFRFPCGAKAVKIGAAEADKAITTHFQFENKSIREGDIFLYGCDMCEERGRCALYKCPFDPHGRRLLLEAVGKAGGKSNAANGHEIAASVADDNLRVPALSMVDVILKVKGFVFDDYSNIVVVSLPPFADLVDRTGNGNDGEDMPLPRSEKF